MPKTLFLDFSEKIVYDRINYANESGFFAFYDVLKKTSLNVWLTTLAEGLKFGLLSLPLLVLLQLVLHP